MFQNLSVNKNGAQLIFVTHDTNLLDNTLMRRDQIYFTEKNKFLETQLYSLAEFKGIRNLTHVNIFIAKDSKFIRQLGPTNDIWTGPEQIWFKALAALTKHSCRLIRQIQSRVIFCSFTHKVHRKNVTLHKKSAEKMQKST